MDCWSKLEKIIKNKESIIILIIILLTYLYIPMKILSYGWNPGDDVNRHAAFSTVDIKWSDVLVMDEKFDIDHNAGWHFILKLFHKYLNFEKEDLLILSIGSLFLLFNLCGIIISPYPLAWCLADLIIINIEPSMIFRIIAGRPYILSCAFSLLILKLWTIKRNEEEKNLLKSDYFKYFFTALLISICVWIHGGWYLFLIIPFSFFLAGETKEALKLTFIIIFSTFIGALLTGDFYNYLYFHTVAIFNIFNEPTYNWTLAIEFYSGEQKIYWVLFFCFIVFLSIYKTNYKLKELANDPCFIMILLCWLGSIKVIRIWDDWGRIALLFWISQRIGILVKNSASLTIPRVRYCLSFFIIVSLAFCYTHDGNGRFSLDVDDFEPIDFYNEATKEELKGWEPQDGGIVYSNAMRVFYQHFYQYPSANWKYVLGYEPTLMSKENLKIFRNLQISGLEEGFAPWISKMTEKDRLILKSKLNSFPELEWIRGSRKWWIGRLKKKNDFSFNEEKVDKASSESKQDN